MRPPSRDTSTVDLVAELDALAAMAEEARRRLAAGMSLNGATALARIQHRASDAARWARNERTAA